MSNWHEITPSEFAWEREALRFVRDRLPRHEPFRAWSNFEFLAEGGQLYEVDLLVCSPRGLFVVEVKSWPGALACDDHTLAWTDPDGRRRHRDHPLRLTNLKAKKLRSLLERQRAAREGGRRAVPFVRPIVFLSDPDVRLDLEPPGRTGVVVRERRAGVPGLEEALLDVTTADHERWRARPQERLDRPAAKVVAGALEQAGVRPSNRLRRVGQYRLGELLGEGHGFQDFAGEHEQLAGVRRRVRIYSAAPDAALERREQLRRAARRELALLEGADYRGILHAVELVDHELGPALVLDASPQAVRLDHWLAEHGARLPLLDRLALIRALAEPVGYAHGRRLVHRALSPRSVLVIDADDPQLRRLKVGRLADRCERRRRRRRAAHDRGHPAPRGARRAWGDRLPRARGGDRSRRGRRRAGRLLPGRDRVPRADRAGSGPRPRRAAPRPGRGARARPGRDARRGGPGPARAGARRHPPRGAPAPGLDLALTTAPRLDRGAETSA